MKPTLRARRIAASSSSFAAQRLPFCKFPMKGSVPNRSGGRNASFATRLIRELLLASADRFLVRGICIPYLYKRTLGKSGGNFGAQVVWLARGCAQLTARVAASRAATCDR